MVTFETRMKIGQAHVGLKASEETRAKLRAYWAKNPKVNSSETRKKMSETRKKMGIKPPRMGRAGAKLWKDNVSAYVGIHNWMRKTYGTPTTCELCGIEAAGRFMHWANISGEYKKDRSDWERLCAKCHRQKDIKNLTILPW